MGGALKDEVRSVWETKCNPIAPDKPLRNLGEDVEATVGPSPEKQN